MFLSGDLLAQELEEILIRCAKSGNIFVVSIDQNNEANQTIDFYQLRGCSKPQRKVFRQELEDHICMEYALV